MTEFVFVTVATEFAVKIIVAIVSFILEGIGLVRSVNKDCRRELKLNISSVCFHDASTVVLFHVDITKLDFTKINFCRYIELTPDRSQRFAHGACGSDECHNPNVLFIS